MPTLTTSVRAAGVTGDSATWRGVAIVDDHGARLNLPFAPTGGTVTGLAPQWEEVARDGGRAPLLIRAGDSLRRTSLPVRLVNPRDPLASVDDYIARLEWYAALGRRVAVWHQGRLLGGRAVWRIVDLEVDVLRRRPGTGTPCDAVANIGLARASDPVANVGATSGGARAVPVAATAGTRGRTITVTPTDTAYGIAYRTLGDGRLATALLDANGVRDARRLTAGQVLTIPEDLTA